MRHWIRQVAIAPLLLALTMATGAVAQDARQVAEDFVSGLLRTATSSDASSMEAYLRTHIDTNYAFNTAFKPVSGAVSSSQQQRLSALMLRFMAREALIVGRRGNDGDIRIGSVKEIDAGTLVEMEFRGKDGEYPFGILVGRKAVDGNLRIRDMGSPQHSSVVERLTYATEALSQATVDADIWIREYERVLSE